MFGLVTLPFKIARGAASTGVTLGKLAFERVAGSAQGGGGDDGRDHDGTTEDPRPAAAATIQRDTGERFARDEPSAPDTPLPPGERPTAPDEVLDADDTLEPAGTPIGEAAKAKADARGFDLDATPEFAERHVDEGATPVASFGPADDVGATIQVGAPFDDYDRLGAAELADRVRRADDTTKALVLLYERANKNRKTVVAAAGG